MVGRQRTSVIFPWTSRILQEVPTKLLRSSNPTDRPYKEGTAKQVTRKEPQQIALQKLKDMLGTAPVLWMPDFDKPFIMQAVALDNGIGAGLLQEYPN